MINLNWYKKQIEMICKRANCNNDMFVKWNSNSCWLDNETCLPNFVVYKRISINGLALICKAIVQVEVDYENKEIVKILLSSENNNSVYITNEEGIDLYNEIGVLTEESFFTTMKFIM